MNGLMWNYLVFLDWKKMIFIWVISLLILNGFFGVFGIVLNIIVVFVIFKNKDLWKGLNLFILSLLLVDFFSNVLV